MRIDRGVRLPERLCDATAQLLNRLTLRWLPEHRRTWGKALVAECAEIGDAWDRLVWAAGGASMTACEFLKNVFGDRGIWATGLALGSLAAVLDLHSETRWTYSIMMAAGALTLACWQPRWAWRWPIPVACCLPAVVVAARNWGPYLADPFDVFYGLVPAAIGAAMGVVLRRGAHRLRHEPGRDPRF